MDPISENSFEKSEEWKEVVKHVSNLQKLDTLTNSNLQPMFLKAKKLSL